jgi:hypothetical protein
MRAYEDCYRDRESDEELALKNTDKHRLEIL